jgi:hypothetical protein
VHVCTESGKRMRVTTRWLLPPDVCRLHCLLRRK